MKIPFLTRKLLCMINQVAEWYFIMGLLTSVIGIFRSIRGKQGTPTDELLALSWFIVWWIWLPIFIFRWPYNYFFKKRKI